MNTSLNIDYMLKECSRSVILGPKRLMDNLGVIVVGTLVTMPIGNACVESAIGVPKRLYIINKDPITSDIVYIGHEDIDTSKFDIWHAIDGIEYSMEGDIITINLLMGEKVIHTIEFLDSLLKVKR